MAKFSVESEGRPGEKWPVGERDPLQVSKAGKGAKAVKKDSFVVGPSTTKAAPDKFAGLPYAEAVQAYQKALAENPDDFLIQFFLGKAHAGAGEYKKAAEALCAYLKRAPRDEEALQLRAAVNQKYLGTLGEGASPEKAEIQKQILADQAMFLALHAEKEKTELEDLEKQFRDFSDGSPEQAQAFVQGVDGLARQYLQLGAIPFANSEDTEFVRGQLNDLAAQAFETLAKFCDASPHEDLKKLAPLYNGYRFLSQGEIEAAKTQFEKIRSESPEADAILKQMDRDRLKLVNLSALDVWEVSMEEHEAVWKDQAGSLLGRSLDKIDKAVRSDGKDHADDFKAEMDVERGLVKEVRGRIEKGDAATIHEALTQISKEEQENLKAKAQAMLDEEVAHNSAGSFLLGHLVRYVSTLDHPAEDDSLYHNIGRTLFNDADQLEARSGGVQTAFGIYAVLQASSPDADLQNACADKQTELQQGKDVQGVLWDMIRTTGTDDLFQMATMAGASKLGSLAKLATLNKLKNAGITGYKAIAIAYTAEVAAEGTALWAMNTAHEAMVHDTAKVFTLDHLAKSYGANLVMIGGLKVFSGAGQKLSPQLARSLGLVVEGGAKLSKSGEALVWGMQHFLGLQGMVATTQVNQALGFSEVPKGGLQESLVHDFFSYLKYGIAQKGFDQALGQKFAAGSEKMRQDIAVKEQQVLTEGYLQKMGFKVTNRSKTGEPVFADRLAQTLYDQLVRETLQRPGFDGTKLAAFLKNKQIPEARAYLRDFGLQLKFEGDKIAGITPMNPKVAALLSLVAKGSGEKGRMAKLASDALQVAKGVALSPAGLFLGTGGLGAGFPHFMPEAPLEPAFVREALEAVKKDPALVSEIYWSGFHGEDAAFVLLAEIAKTDRHAFYQLKVAAFNGFDTPRQLLREFKLGDIPPTIDKDYGHFILAEYGNEGAIESLIGRAGTHTEAREYLGWLASTENPRVLSALGELASIHYEAYVKLCDAALNGSEAALPFVLEAAKHHPNRAYATIHQLVHKKQSEGAREALKNFPIAEVPELMRLDWLCLMVESGNKEALTTIANRAVVDPHAFDALGYLAIMGSDPAIRELAGLAKAKPDRVYTLLHDFAHNKKRPVAVEILKNFKVADVPERDRLNWLCLLAEHENKEALSTIAQLAREDQHAFDALGYLANKGSDPALRELAGFAQAKPDRIFSVFHNFVHTEKRAAAIEFLKNMKMSEVPERGQLNWLHLLVDCGNPDALGAITRLAQTDPHAFDSLRYLANFGSDPAIQELVGFAEKNPNQVFSIFWDLAHKEKRPAAIEALKNFDAKKVPSHPDKMVWLSLLIECRNEGAMEALHQQAAVDENTLATVASMAGEGSEPALRHLAKLAESNEVAFQSLYRLAEKGNEGARERLKQFPATPVPPGLDPVRRFDVLCKFENRGALQELFLRAKGGDERAMESIGLVACNQGSPKAIKLLADLAKTYPKAITELENAARGGRVLAKGELMILSERDPRAKRALATL